MGGVNIPLEANNLTPQQPIDPLQEQMRAAQLKQSAAQTTGLEQGNQAQALQLKDEQLRRSLAPQYVQKDSSGKITGFDNEGLYGDMLAHGADPATIQAMRMKNVELQKALMGLGDAQLEHSTKIADLMGKSLESIQQIQDEEKKSAAPPQPLPQSATPAQPPASPVAVPVQTSGAPVPIGSAPAGTTGSFAPPPEGSVPTDSEVAIQASAANAPRPIMPGAQKAYHQALVRLAAMGINIGQLPPALNDESDLEQAEASIGQYHQIHKDQLADQKTVAETNKATSEGKKADTEAQSSLWKAAGEGTLVNVQTGQMIHGVAPVEVQEMQDWLAKNPGKGPSDFLHYKSTLPINTRYALESGAGVPGPPGAASATPAQTAQRFGMTQEAFDQAAEKYYTTGQLPPVGRGISGIALNRELMNRAGDLHPGASLAANSAAFKANQQSLEKLQTNFDQVSAFENTAGKNLDLFLQTAKPILDSGSPWINQPLRAVNSGALGSVDQAAFNAARQTALTEIAKVLNSSNASGVVSDSARHEIDGLMGPNATLRQIASAANILKQDMANRHQSYQDQINDIQGRMQTGGAQHSAPAQQTSGHQVGDIIVQNGHQFKATKVDAAGKVLAADPQ